MMGILTMSMVIMSLIDGHGDDIEDTDDNAGDGGNDDDAGDADGGNGYDGGDVDDYDGYGDDDIETADDYVQGNLVGDSYDDVVNVDGDGGDAVGYEDCVEHANAGCGDVLW